MFIRCTLLSSVAALGLLAGAAQAQQTPQAQSPVVASDARSALSPGLHDAGQAASGLQLEYAVPPPPGFFDQDALFSPPRNAAEAQAMQERNRANPPRYAPLSLANTDLAISGDHVFMGNFNGFNAYDVSQGEPRLAMSVVCPGGQGDVSVHGNLLFMSVEQTRARLDCGTTEAQGDVNAERFRGVRIFDISDMNAPRQIAAVQTCRGSHTHTLVPSATDPRTLYIYNSGTSSVRKTEELGICSGGKPEDNPETALFSIDVIKVPLDAPEQAAIVSRPRIFANAETGAIGGLWRGGKSGVATQSTAETDQCHDITVYPELNLAAGACSGNGILLDISDRENPVRISEMFDPDMAYWHAAIFNNAGDKVVFTDEWGGGLGARCRAEDPTTWGANVIATIQDRELKGQSFQKLPSIQTANENCVAHNGSLIPVPGRDLLVQAWYQGGISVIDFTDPLKPVEVAYFDRGPIGADRLVMGGVWSAYWFNGRVYGSEIARGLDVLKLTPNDQLSAAEIAAAETVRADVINPQTQMRFGWPDSPDVAEAYLDQLTRAQGVDAALAQSARSEIARWRDGALSQGRLAAVSQSLSGAAATATGANANRLKLLAELLGRVAG